MVQYGDENSWGVLSTFITGSRHPRFMPMDNFFIPYMIFLAWDPAVIYNAKDTDKILIVGIALEAGSV
jgi:hypothetical protein